LTTVGSRTLTASYAGDSNFNSSTSTGVSQTVNANTADLAISKTHVGTFTQGGTGIWTLQVTNNAAVQTAATDGSTVTVTDTLPTGYTLASFTGSGWSCSGTGVVTCTSTAIVNGAGDTFPLISLTVNIPANSPVSVSNTASVFGGGDVVHTSLATAATSNTDSVTVIQVPASIQVSGGNNQSAVINTAFANPLSAMVTDAASVVIPNYSVSFTAPASGASGVFSNATNSITVATNASGVASVPVTANGTSGSYLVTAMAGPVSATFNLTNTKADQTITFAALPNKTYGDADFSVSATASSGLTVSFTASGNCTVSGSTVHLTGAGSCTITAHQPGDSNYNAAPDVASTFTIAQAVLTITANNKNKVFGSANPTLTVSYSNFVNNETLSISDVTGSPSCTTTATTLSPVGAYPITCTIGTLSSNNYSFTFVPGTLTIIQATTSLLYNGGQIVNIGSSFTPAAQLSSPASVCISGQTISFSLDTNPLTGVAGSYSLGSAITNSSGQATMGAVGTTGWLEGVYTLTANFVGTASCSPSSAQVTLTVASSGDSANGGGWYTLSGSGRINFGFTVSKTDNSCTSNCTYKGQLLLINNGKWRLKGTLSSYVKTSTGTGAASGTGNLFWWNQSLNGGLGDWELAQSGVNFTINFYDSGKTGKQSTDSFAINIQYIPVSPQPSNLPNSNTLTVLKGGDIKVK
jgi:hypothetical protein